MKFSIRAIIAFTAIVAFLSAAAFAFPDSVASLSFIIFNVVICAMLVATVAYGSHGARAFALGAVMLPISALFWGTLLLMPLEGNQDVVDMWETIGEVSLPVKLLTALTWGVALIAGSASLCVYRFFLQPTTPSNSD